MSGEEVSDGARFPPLLEASPAVSERLHTPPEAGPRVSRWLGGTALVFLLAAASVALPKLSLPAGLATLLTFLSLPAALSPSTRRTCRYLLGGSALLSTVAMFRFVATEAIVGMTQGGNSATAGTAVSRLRDISFAQDVMRRKAWVDPDGDGIGSAALIDELSGRRPLRSGAKPTPPLLESHFTHLESTPLGPAANVGRYLFMVCLPRAGGGWTARPGEPVDEELAERRFIAYAWPAASGSGPDLAFAIDEHERILVLESAKRGQPRYASPNFPPACDASLTAADSWKPWRGKRPRSTLPGDHP